MSLLRELGRELLGAGAELALEEVIEQHGPKLAALRAVATLRKLDADTLRILAARIEATGAEPGEEARARAAAVELVQAIADWNDAAPAPSRRP